MSRYSGKIKDLMKKPLAENPEIERAFKDYSQAEWARLFRIICWIGIVAMPAGFSLDVNVYPQYVPYFLRLRLLSSVVIALFMVFFYSRPGLKFRHTLFLAMPLVPQAAIAWMIYATEGSISPYYAGLCVVLVAFCLVLPWTFQEVASFSLATLGMYLAACVAHGGVSLNGIFFSNFYFLSMTALFATIGSYFTSRLRVREFVTRFELDRNKKTLEQTNQKLVELDRMKTQFFANISHELRTPLTLLIAPLEELLRQNSLDASGRETLKLMQGNAMRLLKLINDLLDMAKLDSGRMGVKKEPLAVEEFIKGLIQSVQGAAKDKRVRLSLSVSREIGTIFADGDKLEKIILNLLFNSVKFTPAGGSVELLAALQEGALVLRVKDTGMGISEKDLPHIFDRFWQADASAQRKYQGTGIGLSLVKEMVEVQGGTVGVESQLGKGTTITVQIPAEKVSETAPSEVGDINAEPKAAGLTESVEWLQKLYRRAELFPAITPVAATLKSDDYGKAKRPRVLVADDEPDMLRFLKSQLEKHYEIIEAVDGNQAMEKARQFLPDLILLDMMMPEKDGIEACKELRGLVSTQAIPVVLLTARADDETKMAALSAGASDFLTKPFSTSELHIRVKNLIESHQLQMDLARQKIALESTLEQLKETEAQLVQNEKMASLGRLSAGIIHEINNPLNYANSALHLLRKRGELMPETERDKFVEIVSDITDGVGRVQRIVSDLRTFSHPHSGGKDWFPLKDVVATSLQFLSHELKERVEVTVQVPEEQLVMADRNKLVQVFVNLLQNSTDALKAKDWNGDKPTITIKSRAGAGRVWVAVRDNGMGISPEDMGKIFDPFFTTKDVGEGMGLGLSICYKIVHELGGEITVKSEKGQFTEFVLELPSKT